jgi:hypothetical protein
MIATMTAPARVEIRRFRSTDELAIKALNGRLAAAGFRHEVGCEDPRMASSPGFDAYPIIERLYVAAEGPDIRGGVWLKEQLFWAEGRDLRAGWAKYPVAESLVSGAAAGVPASLLFTVLREQPCLMALGMGGHDGSFAKLLAAARWSSSLVPFFFRIQKPFRVLRQLSLARSTPMRRALADGLAFTGLGWTANRVLAGIDRITHESAGFSRTVVPRFGEWADELWARCRHAYGFVARRDSNALNSLYPEDFSALTRLRVTDRERDAGWVCVRAIDCAGTWFEHTFGNLRLGMITDGFARPADAKGVFEAGVAHLMEHDVDLIVTFQSHPAWCDAAREMGLLPGPSNCAFYRAPAVEKILQRAESVGRFCHLTSSDGDGPQPV